MEWQRTELELENPGFEGPYREIGAGEVKVAHGWEPFWSLGNPSHEWGQGPCARPEYKPVAASQFPQRVLSGEYAQAWFLNYRVMDAGVLTYVDVPGPGFIEFSVHAQAWCDNGDDPNRSRGEMYVSLGIDANNLGDPWEVGVIWTPWTPLDGVWLRLSTGPVHVSQAGRVAVLIRAWNKWRLKHNDVYVDNAHVALLEPVGEGAPPEPPTPGEGVDYQRIEELMRRVFREEWPTP